jgi:pyridoxine 4-dehydrogenase
MEKTPKRCGRKAKKWSENRFNSLVTNEEQEEMKMIDQNNIAGSFTLAGTSMTLNRIGYGAMQLAGRDGDKLVWGPPRDIPGALAVLREAVASGVNHIDTSDYYGPHVTNQIIKQALHPYSDDLVIVTKVGARRGSDGSWVHARSRQQIVDAVHDNLRNLGLDALHVVNLRLGGFTAPEDEPFEEPLSALAELKQKGLIRHIGLSTVSSRQLVEAQAITEIACIQNLYNMTQRGDDQFVDNLAAQGIAYVPYFPLGGFTPLQSSRLNEVATSLGATPMQVALAWLLQRSPNILLIPGTSSLEHLRENLQSSRLQIPTEMIADLDAIGMPGAAKAMRS